MGSDGDATEESLFPQNLNLELAGVKRLEEGGKRERAQSAECCG